MRRLQLLCWLLLAVVLAFGQTPPAAPAAPAQPAESPQGKRVVYEGVVGFKGKPIGTTIMLELSESSAGGSDPASASITGWIQRNDFYAIDSGRADKDQIAFTSGGNQYAINLRTSRINYSGPDGNGNQRVEQMTRVTGRLYRLTEGLGEETHRISLQNEDGEREYLVEAPSIWKRAGPPIDRFEYERLKDVLGKNVSAWLARIGGTRYMAVLEEPEGLDLQKKPPKKEKEKKKK